MVLLLAALVGAWYVGSRAYAAISLSDRAQLIRWCGGKVAFTEEGRQRRVENGQVVFDDPQGVSRGIDVRWKRLFKAGRGPKDVCGVEFPRTLEDQVRPGDLRNAVRESATFPNLAWLVIPPAVVDEDDAGVLSRFKQLKLLVVNANSDPTVLRTLLATNPECQIYLSDPEFGNLTPLK